jgi:single-strand DNA-binding protein
MSDLNVVSFTGRLTKDPEMKTLPSGTTLVTFDIANNTGWGQYKKTIFLTCNVWGKIGSGIFPYLKKGKNVAVTGTLEVQEWTGNADGLKHSKNVINCRECLLMQDGGGATATTAEFKDVTTTSDEFRDATPYQPDDYGEPRY